MMRNEIAGPFQVTFMGAGVWAGIPDELPPSLCEKQVWVTTEDPNLYETIYQVSLMDGCGGWKDVSEKSAKQAKLQGLIVRAIKVKQ